MIGQLSHHPEHFRRFHFFESLLVEAHQIILDLYEKNTLQAEKICELEKKLAVNAQEAEDSSSQKFDNSDKP